jgi:ribosomal protein S11|tara:strand:+ start:468 stop:914 length:447 start_codon:yes stop_codon:yes gene_type:complete
MNNHKRRSFRPRPQKSGFRRRSGSSTQSQNGHYQTNNGNVGFNRNGSMTNPFNVEKTVQKFQQLAKDAQTSGDPVLVESYLQYADHYIRRLAELNSKIKPIQQENKLADSLTKPTKEEVNEVSPAIEKPNKVPPGIENLNKAISEKKN